MGYNSWGRQESDMTERCHFHFVIYIYMAYIYCPGQYFSEKLCIVISLSHVQLFLTPWAVAHQAPLPMGFPRQEYWSG